MKKHQFISINIIIITGFLFLFYSCKQNKISEIERIIIDEKFINKEIQGHDSISTVDFDNSTGTIYHFGDTMTIYVMRNNNQRIIGWFKFINGIDIEGAEVYEKTGQIMGKVKRVNGKIDGPVKYYFENGRVRTTGQYKNNYPYGEWNEYDHKGNLISIIYYNDDRTTTVKEIN